MDLKQKWNTFMKYAMMYAEVISDYTSIRYTMILVFVFMIAFAIYNLCNDATSQQNYTNANTQALYMTGINEIVIENDIDDSTLSNQSFSLLKPAAIRVEQEQNKFDASSSNLVIHIVK